jgi:glycosyltransferase involved in cell wall biosynthesis
MEKLSEDKYLASIIIINYNGKEETINCLKSLYGFLKGKNYEVIVVDNNSNYHIPIFIFLPRNRTMDLEKQIILVRRKHRENIYCF